MEYDVVTLENGKDYLLFLEKDNYILFVNKDDPKDQCIRKKISEDNEVYYQGLDDEKELLKAIGILLPKLND